MSTLTLNLICKLDNFTLKINQSLDLNGITGIYGHSGCGKSTLLRIIAGLNNHAVGQLSFNSVTLQNSTLPNNTVPNNTFPHNKSHHENNLKNKAIFIPPQKRNFSLVFQDNRLFPHLNVRENLIFAAKRCNNSQLKLDDVIKLTRLSPLANKPVTTLSGGEQQRVALARAILAEPKLLLLDEPLSALDQKSKTNILQLLKQIQKQLNIPMLYVSHSLDELQQIADNLMVLSQGEVINFGAIHQVIHQLNYQSASQTNNQADNQANYQQTSLSLPIKMDKEHPLNNHGLATLCMDDGQEIYLPSHLIPSQIMPSQIIPSQLLPSKSLHETINNKADNKVENEAENTKLTLRCFILASDISLCKTASNNSSIVNHLVGVISKIRITDHNVLVTINCAEQEFFASISSFSLDRLALKPEQTIYMQFKASAVRTFIY